MVCNRTKLRFIKKLDVNGSLSSLGIKTYLIKIPFIPFLLFEAYQQVNTRYKMNERVSKFLLAGDRFMPEIHLRQPVDGPFTRNKKKMRKFTETGDSRYIYQNKLDKTCFQLDMDYGYFKDKAFNIAKNSKYYEYQRGLASAVDTNVLKKMVPVMLLKVKLCETKN